MLLIHGTADALVPYGQAERVMSRREAAGLATQLETFAGQRHGWLQQPTSPASEEAIERIAMFLDAGPRVSSPGGRP